MRVIVTGSRGFLGQHLVNALRDDGRVKTLLGIGRHGGEANLDQLPLLKSGDYAEFNADICNDISIQTILLGFRPDYIFHSAAVPIIRLDNVNPTTISEINILGTQRLLHYCPKGCKFIFASSAAVYGDLGEFKACKEIDATHPTSVYGATKVASEAFISAYCGFAGLKAVSLRFAANVGRGATHGVVKDIVNKLKSGNPNLELLGDYPGSFKPYTYVGDSIQAIIKLGLSDIPMESPHAIYNVGLESRLCIADLAEVIIQSSGIKKPIKWLGEAANWSGDNRYVQVSNAKARLCGWQPQYKTASAAVYQAVKELI